MNKNCPCPKTNCHFHGNCAACVIKHNNAQQLPFCIFPDNDGDKSIKNFCHKYNEKTK